MCQTIGGEIWIVWLRTRYFSNAVGIIATLGLLTPWAVMRTLKYRADNMRVLVDGELTALTGATASAVQAAGAELGAIFDVDLSL